MCDLLSMFPNARSVKRQWNEFFSLEVGSGALRPRGDALRDNAVGSVKLSLAVVFVR